MLTIRTKEKEFWDEEKEQFYYIPGCELKLEHSLLSVAEWESKYHKSFINTDKTIEETIDYVKMMVVGDKPDDEVFLGLSKEVIEEIYKYINDPMTATTISEEEENEINKKNTSKGKFTTSEEIYSWMVAQQIPFECEKWHLNRLIVLIKLCAINNKPKDKKPKKMTSSDLALRRAKMNAARAKYGQK